MSRKIIRLGDPTDHGGQVVASGAPHFIVGGKPVALKGDACSCPERGHSGCTIAEGDPNHTINGVPVACEGHKTTCGAALIATVDNYTLA
jgi:uncharacterized Zn-binding protein involved in type VI secretion